MKTKTKGTRVVHGNIHNPAKTAKWSLGLPGERNTMAAKANKPKKRSKSKGGRRNTAAKKTSTPKSNSAAPRKAASTRRPTTTKANSSRRKKKPSRRNGFTFKGLNAVDLGVGALSLITTQALAQAASGWIDPSSILGIGAQLGMAAVAYAVAPGSIRNAVVAGAGITPVANLINRLTGNVIGSTITDTVRGFLPAAPTPQTTTDQQGMGSLVNYDQASPYFRQNYQYQN
jgi:hypothetical protein